MALKTINRIIFAAIIILIPMQKIIPQDISEDIHNCIKNVKQGNALSFDFNHFNDAKEVKRALKILPEYFNDSLSNVRLAAIKLLYNCGLKSDDIKIKQVVVEKLVSRCRDNNSGVSSYASNCLCSFSQNDFNNNAKYILRDLVKEHPYNFDVVLKITGLANMSEMVPLYKSKLVHDSLLTTKGRWALHLTMARLGEKTEIDYCLLKVKRYQVNDALVSSLLPDLIYTRQKKLIDFLIEIVKSDRQSCSSSNPDSNKKILCAFRVMEYLTPVIKNYPFKLLPSGDIDTKDYEEALITLRKWFDNNPDYLIITETY